MRGLRPQWFFAVALITNLSQADATILSGRDPWIRAAPPGITSLAGYVVIRNGSNDDLQLMGARSRYFNKIELHQTIVDRGIARMQQPAQIKIPANTDIALEPGGYHLMLLHPGRVLKSGDGVPVILMFSEGRTLTLDFVVK